MSVRKYVYSRGDACHTKDCKATHYLQIPDTPATRAVLAEAKEFVHANPTVEERVIADLLSLFEEEK